MIAKLLLYFIKIYQGFISPIFPSNCRFYPSCSVYGKQSILKYGLFKGSFLSIKRVLKCHPFGASGEDPVP